MAHSFSPGPRGHTIGLPQRQNSGAAPALRSPTRRHKCLTLRDPPRQLFRQRFQSRSLVAIIIR